MRKPAPDAVAAWSIGKRRKVASISNNVISATAWALVPGRLQTGMPRACAAFRSMVFTPTPIFWISRRRGAAAIISAVAGFRTCQITSVSGSKPHEQRVVIFWAGGDV